MGAGQGCALCRPGALATIRIRFDNSAIDCSCPHCASAHQFLCTAANTLHSVDSAAFHNMAPSIGEAAQHLLESWSRDDWRAAAKSVTVRRVKPALIFGLAFWALRKVAELAQHYYKKRTPPVSEFSNSVRPPIEPLTTIHEQ